MAAVVMVAVRIHKSDHRRMECERRRLRFVGGFGFMVLVSWFMVQDSKDGVRRDSSTKWRRSSWRDSILPSAFTARLWWAVDGASSSTQTDRDVTDVTRIGNERRRAHRVAERVADGM